VSTENVESITPAQCRAARALLGINQPKLAEQSGLGLSTIVDFEKMRRRVSDEAVEAIRLALKRMGVEFINENGGGPGLRLRKPRGRLVSKK
jgi:transcriptional regulator with XRE-family HTH domain